MNLPLQSNTLTANSVEYWRKGLVYTEHWDREDFVRWMQSMIDQGQVQNTETYQGAAKPPESLHLHFVPFTQGMLYVGNTSLLTNDEIDPVKSLAEAFSIAYARYEDFIKLEKAKQSIEVTLTELKATQTQLIQSEKMASLGELTAGIAHEIQNPLNFVNNFSEVNKELLAELAEEIEKGNYEEVKIIANDVIGNEEKISHHGRRADAIVKGMLQHSRTSSGQKEPTDINVLADEYLRLAYHGLRAKDKSFNATMKTDYDSTLEKINVIPQDIGRVILNLITNAFYAIHEKAKQQTNGLPAGQAGYEPTISISTKKLGDKIFISVKDNGGGIPQKVVDKIFQPFCTTKPTGQGTGLGLSLSYDIMKAHGGDIKVETMEGEGSEFIIQLPM
jgi:signal transduction histidine kinase